MDIIHYDGHTILINRTTGDWFAFRDAVKEIDFDFIQDIDEDLLRRLYPTELSDELVSVSGQMNRITRHVKPIAPCSLLIINTSNRCNLKCDYCYVSSDEKGEMITPATIINIIDAFVHEMGTDRFDVLFQGGEPLLSFTEIREAVSHYRKQGTQLAFRIQTNGTLLSEDSLYFCKTNSIMLGISKDGNSRQTNSSRSTDCLDVFESTTNAQALLGEIGCRYGVISVVTKSNVDVLSNFSKELIGTGVRRFSFNPFYPIGRAEGALSHLPDVEDFTGLMKHVFHDLASANMSIGKGLFEMYSEQNLEVLWKRIFYGHNNQSLCAKIPCGAGKSTYTVDYNGDIYPCTYFLPSLEAGHKIGNITNVKGAIGAARDSIVNKRALGSIVECGSCPYGFLCGGGGCTGAIYHMEGINGRSYYCGYYKEIIPFLIVETMKLASKDVLRNF